MARILSLPCVKALLFDLDGTLYRCPEYLQDGAKGEVNHLATLKNLSFGGAEGLLQSTKEMIQGGGRQTVGRGQTILAMGIAQSWWNAVRNECYDPEKFLRPWPGLAERMSALVNKYRVAVVSNSPTALCKRVLSVIGLGGLLDRIKIVGGDDALPKPASEPFAHASRVLQIPRAQCLSIGDRVEFDAWPAMRLGMGAVIVDGMQDLLEFLDGLIGNLDASIEHCFDLSRFLLDTFMPGEVQIIGITGQAGGGKTTTSYVLEELGREKSIPSQVLPLDCFFKLSSKQRKVWLDEGKRIGPEEYARRADQTSWWNFDSLQESLHRLQRGQDLHLRGVYNRADHGELTLDMDLPISPQGKVVVLEGVAIAHLREQIGQLIYLHAPRDVRKQRLLQRDPHRVGPEAQERFHLTELFERQYFPSHFQKIDKFVDNGRAVPVLMSEPPPEMEL